MAYGVIPAASFEWLSPGVLVRVNPEAVSWLLVGPGVPERVNPAALLLVVVGRASDVCKSFGLLCLTQVAVWL